jgi:hypothetical protein
MPRILIYLSSFNLGGAGNEHWKRACHASSFIYPHLIWVAQGMNIGSGHATHPLPLPFAIILNTSVFEDPDRR